MAIYQSKFLQPYNTTIDGTLINPFQFTCQGTSITKYNAKIYRVSDNVQVYTTGDINLSPSKFNGDVIVFNVPANSCTNGTQYKWDVTTYENATLASSFQVTFWANATATLTMTIPATVTTQQYVFTATYSQSNNVPLSYFYFVLSDSTGELDRTDLTFSGNVTATFNGFVSGNNYSVRVYGVTTNGATVNSPIYNFTVSYAKPSINITPTITQDCKTSLVTTTWGNIVQILGSVVGGYSIFSDYGILGNYALALSQNSYYTSSLTIPQTMSVVLQWKKGATFTTGKIVELTNGSGYEFGYNSTLGKFYFTIGGVIGYSQAIALPTTDFFIILEPTEAYVKIGSVTYPVRSE